MMNLWPRPVRWAPGTGTLLWALAPLVALLFLTLLVGCSDDTQFDKKIAEAQQQQADYCKANPGVCERYCQDYPLEKTCPK